MWAYVSLSFTCKGRSSRPTFHPFFFFIPCFVALLDLLRRLPLVLLCCLCSLSLSVYFLSLLVESFPFSLGRSICLPFVLLVLIRSSLCCRSAFLRLSALVELLPSLCCCLPVQVLWWIVSSCCCFLGRFRCRLLSS